MNVEHLMAYVDEQKAEGNAAFRRGAAGRSEALAAWQRALDACAQCDGKPMRREDIAVVLAARSVLHSNRGQALIDGEWWHRAVKELDHAVRIDPSNAKALWRRYRCQKHLKKWAEAEADFPLEEVVPNIAGGGGGRRGQLVFLNLHKRCLQREQLQPLEAVRLSQLLSAGLLVVSQVMKLP